MQEPASYIAVIICEDTKYGIEIRVRGLLSPVPSVPPPHS